MSSLSIIIAIFSIIHTSYAQLTWTEITPSTSDAPSGRQSPAVAYDQINNILLVNGGRTGDNEFSDETWIFNMTSLTWTLLSNIGTKPAARYTAVAGYDPLTGQFLVSTGEGKDKEFYNDLWALDYQSAISTATDWIQLDADASTTYEVRYGSAGGLQVDTSNLIISHGFASRRFSDTFTYDISEGTSGDWEETFGGTNEYNPNAPHPRCLVGSTETTTGLVMYGGCLNAGFSGGPCPALDTWFYEASDKTWTQKNDGPVPSTFAGMAPSWMDEGQVFLYGGSQATTLQKIGGTAITADNIHVLDVESGEWTSYETKDSPDSVLSQHKMVNTGSGLLVFGGRKDDDDEDRSNALYYLQGSISSGDEISGFSYFSVLYLHGILMWIGWGCMLQTGAFIARFFRHRGAWWFKPCHLYCQRGGFVVQFFGLICAFIGGGVPVFAHGAIGVIIFLLAVFQVIYGECRPHHGEPRRWLFELLHPWSGRTAIFLALINITLGCFCIVAPVGVWAVWLIQFCIIVLAYPIFELNKRGIITLPGMNPESQDKNKKTDEEKPDHQPEEERDLETNVEAGNLQMQNTGDNDGSLSGGNR